VPYAAHVQPLPGSGCVLASDGTDLFVVAVLAAADRSLAPRAYRNSDQTLTSGVDTPASFAAAESDAWGCWSGSQPTRLTAPVTGRYQATGWVTFAANATGQRVAWVRRNGAVEVGRVQVPALAGNPTQLALATPAFTLSKGDYIELFARQDSGGDLALTRTADVSPALSLTYLGP
jgi:hypothetical protein